MNWSKARKVSADRSGEVALCRVAQVKRPKPSEYVINARFDGLDVCGKAVRAGDLVAFNPRTRKIRLLLAVQK